MAENGVKNLNREYKRSRFLFNSQQNESFSNFKPGQILT